MEIFLGTTSPKITVNWAPIAGTGGIDTICPTVCHNHCDRSTACGPCRLEPPYTHLPCHPKASSIVDEESDVYDFIIDSGILMQSLHSPTVQENTFDLYFYNALCPRVRHDLKRATSVNIVRDQYRGTDDHMMHKGKTRSRHTTMLLLITGRNCSNSCKKITEEHFPNYKKCLHVGKIPLMDQCNHDERTHMS